MKKQPISADEVRVGLMLTSVSFAPSVSLWEYGFKRPLYSITSSTRRATAVIAMSSVLFLYYSKRDKCVCICEQANLCLPFVCVCVCMYENKLYKRLAVSVSGPCSVLDVLISPAV